MPYVFIIICGSSGQCLRNNSAPCPGRASVACHLLDFLNGAASSDRCWSVSSEHTRTLHGPRQSCKVSRFAPLPSGDVFAASARRWVVPSAQTCIVHGPCGGHFRAWGMFKFKTCLTRRLSAACPRCVVGSCDVTRAS